VHTEPNGAEVIVGSGEHGVSPFTLKELKAGRYPVRARAAGYEEWSGEAVVRPNDFTRVDASLVRSTGEVVIRGSPSGAEVSDGSKVLGVVPLTLAHVPTGDVKYFVRAKGYQSVEVCGTVTRNSELKLSAALTKVKMPEAGQRWTISDLGLELLPIAAGSFSLGSSKGETDEQPVTQVTFSQPFWLAKTEVTQAQWTALMGKNPSGSKNPDQPVEQVSWSSAMDFCKKLTERERLAGRLPEGFSFTLPTEAQWEYACRAGTTEPYAGALETMGWYSGNSGNKSHPVGEKQANAWGLYDMHGGVWEWCLDWYGPYKGGSITDPKGATAGTRRVVRGGSWNSQSSRCRSSVRDGWEPRQSGNNLGFRVSLIQAPAP
ncbi:MAG TPA: SUMF1/EgtB/PvdO family nonheme iron enzyme, partial [Candidatus Didemnitutus sp.]|nr:SUMF1/EgtB/PvdO family nonheme iron enzyme [Candidatus Didemnitutus sp.]